MTERSPGEYTPYDTRAEANETVDRKLRYRQIIECLKEKPRQTAKEIAMMMYMKGYIPNSERNFTAPRLTELSKQGVVEPVSRTKCRYTGKSVSVYALRPEPGQQLSLY
ncbi:MAG: DNA gyrase [Clostridia bacterium]|nr:DNA gyrase [Clostridia bacterium]